MFILGIDAGGTKTHCVISDEHGNIIKEGFDGPANYQTCGIDVTKTSLELAIQKALDNTGLKINDISRAVFGMAGADEEIDFKLLNPLAESIMKGVPVEVVNDTWIGLRAAVEDNFGIVSICGTGAAHAGRNRKGEAIILRNFDFPLGNRGGGGELVDWALHYAFRSNEQTFKKTCLEEDIVQIFQVDNMEEVYYLIRQGGMTESHQYQIPIAVFNAARRGDAVAVMLVEDMGHTEGQYAAGLIRRLSLEKESVPMVLIGSLFKTREPILIDPYMKAVHEAAPLAYPLFPTVSPVMGAIGLMMDLMKTSNIG